MNTSPARAVHPSPTQLAAFGLGKLAPAEHAEVERHVAECESCCRVLSAIPDDTLMQRLRSNDTLFATSDTDAQPPPKKAAQPAREQEIPPELVDHPRYRIIKLLGAGGMGLVYQAEHRMMERPVALKVIKRNFLSNSTAVERFEREVKAAAKLSHPNIVVAHDAEQAGDLHFLVMEYVDGVSLAKLVEKRGALPVVNSCHYIRQAALGLQHAFERGMVHRDIKPQNLMLTRQGQVKILDFGLARLAREAGPISEDGTERDVAPVAGGLTMAGTILGTPDYMAPEQASDSRQADIRADIYSLGCTLYFLLAGRVPFPQGSVTQKIASQMVHTPPPISQLRQGLPDDLVRIIEKMMAKDPADRFQTPAELAQALLPFAKAAPAAASGVESAMREPAKPSVAGTPTTRIADFGEIPIMEQDVRDPKPRKPSAVTTFLKSPVGIAVAACVCLLMGWGIWSQIGGRDPARGTGSKSDASGSKPKDALAATAPPPRVLMVLPHEGFINADYEPVRAIMEKNAIRVEVTSSEMSPARPQWTQPVKGQRTPDPVMPDVALDEAKPVDYDAVIFVGGSIWEFMGGQPAQRSAKRLMQSMLDEGRLVTGLCAGTNVLAYAGLLRGKQAARSQFIKPEIQEKSGAIWKDSEVILDGQILTGRDYTVAPQFANKLVYLLNQRRQTKK